jgi:hypothetical protein
VEAIILNKDTGLGFRDPHCFNLAMMSIQILRLLTTLNPYVPDFFVQNTIPMEKILNAKIKSGSSFTWQSIVARLQCFNRVVIWRAGDGIQIEICTNQLIPSSPIGEVMTAGGTNIYSKVQ